MNAAECYKYCKETGKQARMPASQSGETVQLCNGSLVFSAGGTLVHLDERAMHPDAFMPIPEPKLPETQIIEVEMKQYTDRGVPDQVIQDMYREHDRQCAKWGKQTRSAFEWLAYLMEEVGELAEAISEEHYRDGVPEDVVKEAVQAATLAAKIAAMFSPATKGQGVTMTVGEHILQYGKEHGFTGLFNRDGDCACRLLAGAFEDCSMEGVAACEFGYVNECAGCPKVKDCEIEGAGEEGCFCVVPEEEKK